MIRGRPISRLILMITFLAPTIFGQIPTAREKVLEAMRQRPNDPWPRGVGHVLLAVPGSEEMQKAYHEPGGSFSPAVRSFGLSIWITSADGIVLKTSDNIPLSALKQKLVWPQGNLLPSISTEAEEYEALWSVGPENGICRLVLSTRPQADHKVSVVIRSVGPAGDAIESLKWNGQRLRVNGRYCLGIQPEPVSVHVGPEGPAGWKSVRNSTDSCSAQDGWCYARIELAGKGDHTLVIQDSYPRPAPVLPAASTRASLEMKLPDSRFADALDAQVAQLMMGLVSNQTRPGEPVNYPLVWLRDGAFQVVSLVRAGRLETARELARYFAENDFFGGFGAEGDAPGLSLWAIIEVACRIRDKEFDEYLWPHVRRKAEFILGLAATRSPVERFSITPLVPSERFRKEIYEVAKPAEDGLIAGRMDHATRPLFTSAVAYRGLMLASGFAQQIGSKADAEHWRKAAKSLQEAWLRRFTPADEDERTFMCGLFPSWIAAPERAKYEAGLQRHWQAIWNPGKGGLHDPSGNPEPLWTYFNFAHAHNWLYAGRLEPVWETLNWFWNHQASPGLYTWWEGRGEENAFRQWDYVRGWVMPPHVTPHYWSAATHLLLQLDMLCYVDESDELFSLIVGGGIPKEWCSHPMKVHGSLTRIGMVNWDWDGHTMRVTVRGNRCPVRLGPGFPKDAQVKVEYSF
jgi:hypothetical protein